MILETLTMLTNALNHPQYGVAAQYASIPTASLTVDVMRPALIVSEVTHPQVAADSFDGPYPALLVMQADDVQLMQRNSAGSRDAVQYSAAIAYRGKTMPQDKGISVTLLTMRAVQRSLEAFFSNEHAEDRSLNGVQLWSYDTMTQTPALHNVEDDKQECTVKIIMNVRDTVL